MFVGGGEPVVGSPVASPLACVPLVCVWLVSSLAPFGPHADPPSPATTAAIPQTVRLRRFMMASLGGAGRHSTAASVISSPRSIISNPSRSCSGVIESGGLHMMFHQWEIVYRPSLLKNPMSLSIAGWEPP